jgi:hypothetical protein
MRQDINRTTKSTIGIEGVDGMLGRRVDMNNRSSLWFRVGCRLGIRGGAVQEKRKNSNCNGSFATQFTGIR